MKKCCKCKIEKNQSEFGNNKTTWDGLQPYCRRCKQNIAKSWYNGRGRENHLASVKRNNLQRHKLAQDFLWDYLKSHPCCECGESDPILLDFDHTERATKYDCVCALMYRVNLKILKTEVEKCQVLCTVCHRRKTAKENRSWRYLKSLEECSYSSIGRVQRS